MSFSLKAFLGLKKRRVTKTAPKKAVQIKPQPAEEPVTEVIPLSHDGAKAYWASRRNGAENEPISYANVDLTRTKFLEEKIRKHMPSTARILEVGPNAGRNLAYLHDMGFTNLAGIEINPAAVEVMRRSYPQLADIPITVSPIEDAIKAIEDGSFDLIFTMAVLEHVHSDSNWIFAEMARIASNLLTIEDEISTSVRHFPRQYKTVFEGLGMKEVDFSDVVPGLTKKFRYRFFQRDVS
ncbi:class I SAM-dependent methyltransferase [Rhizobiaceae bacterium n13]|uniref:Class I SAM-dependent methyltransferase n=1 Tax=Ferirhizobium litorale TaxID=2927786 RepID=A0AAE3U369_9HYPH|nr:class I SAM-dependent methyltransferase [Fererhizobium litorale]MDI7863637.1 class I SAM-dependent methyltransferase [Fererhizobium litorale]MDI7923442.1 class I SAM-dependent methyltransferase [Fererhizobium litorale]